MAEHSLPLWVLNSKGSPLPLWMQEFISFFLDSLPRGSIKLAATLSCTTKSSREKEQQKRHGQSSDNELYKESMQII